MIGIFLFKLTFLFQVEGFNYSRDLFYSSSGVSIQVEIFFLQVEMFLFKSRFFHVEIFISSREFFFSSRDFYFKSRFLSHVESFFMSTFFLFKRIIFFLSQVDIFVLFEVFQVDISQFKARCYPGVLVGISWQ